MEIRRLSIADYDQVVKLWRAAGLPFKPRGRDRREAVAAEMAANPDFFLGAFKASVLVGVAVASCDLRRGWINRLAVDPKCRSRGVARALVGECERRLRERGVRIFCALIEDSNVQSRSLFRKCGYVEHHDILYLSKRESKDV